jgi:hypothetical protein
MERSLSLTPSCVVELQVRLFNRRWKGLAPEYVFYLWVGWLLQCQTIDGPACQGVLIWDEVCQVGMWAMLLQPPV